MFTIHDESLVIEAFVDSDTGEGVESQNFYGLAIQMSEIP
jgi:hypothetical protein